MANIIQNMIEQAGAWMASKIAPYLSDDLAKHQSVESAYYRGEHRPQLKSKPGATDDNVTQNFVGLAVDRSVSRLFKGGVTFNLPDGSDEQDEYLKKVWDLNKKEIILYQVGLHGAVYGTPYFKICPDELIDPYTGELYPRLIPIDPEIIRVVPEPDNMDEVQMYLIEYQVVRKNFAGGKYTTGYREVTRRAKEGEAIDDVMLENNTWIVEDWIQNYTGIWVLEKSTSWPYDFPPIHHCKNLPSLKSCYGDSDIDDVIGIQDKSNFVTSNTGKIIKIFAHPTTIIKGVSVEQLAAGRLDSAIGVIYAIPTDADAKNLEMQSDLASSVAFGQNLRQSIFDIAREVDISSMADKLGQLTNFGLQVLWSDAIDKNDTKRQLYGDAILEINRRLLVLKGWEKEASNPGDLAWGNPLPVNIKEELEADQIALNLGIIDLETLTKKYKYRYGQDYETIQANIAKQAQADNANNANIGATILRNFNQGQ
jgi:hypothetical protein